MSSITIKILVKYITIKMFFKVCHDKKQYYKFNYTQGSHETCYLCLIIK